MQDRQPPAIELTTLALALPVHLAIPDAAGGIAQGAKPVQGTCFPLGGPFMMTAGHVVTGLQDDEQAGRGVGAVGVFHPQIFAQFGVRIAESEGLGADLAIIRVDFADPAQEGWLFPVHWSRDPLPLGGEVRTPGYAYGDHWVGNERQLVQRSFQGSIVANYERYLPLGMQTTPFGAYELSFTVPLGQSGAPLLRADGRVAGIVIGNSRSRMKVLESEEISDDGKTTTKIEQYESLTMGVAVQAGAALERHSKLLGTSVERHLRQRDLLH